MKWKTVIRKKLTTERMEQLKKGTRYNRNCEKFLGRANKLIKPYHLVLFRTKRRDDKEGRQKLVSIVEGQIRVKEVDKQNKTVAIEWKTYARKYVAVVRSSRHKDKLHTKIDR